MKKPVIVISGPNLNLLGTCEPHGYPLAVDAAVDLLESRAKAGKS